MIYGTYSFKIDSHGRVQIPSQVRKYFEGSEVCLVRNGNDGSFHLYPKLSEPEEQELLKLNPTNKKRLEYFSRKPIRIDSQKRIILGLKFKGLEAILIGNGNHLIVHTQKANW